MPTWIFFDLDETLMDHQTAARRAARRFYRQYEPHLDDTEEQFLAKWRPVGEKYFDMYLRGEIDWATHSRLRMRALFPPAAQLSDTEADSRFATYVKAYEESWLLFPDALPCLDALAHRNLGIISNGKVWQQQLKINRLGIGHRFKTVTISGAIGTAKPDPAIFSHACGQVGAKPNDCMYVGDRLDVDALAAQQAGMHGVWLNRTGVLADAAAHVHIIRSLAELLPLVNR